MKEKNIDTTEKLTPDEQSDDKRQQSRQPESAAGALGMGSVSESDDAPVGSLSLRQIVGGDYLMLLVRNHAWLIVLIVLITTIYVGFRYQCQQDMIEIDQLEKNLTDAKYKALSSSSNLTELCRQSHVLQVLRANQDSLLRVSDQPPYKIEVPE
ncbi:MAG: hypothetical protein J6M25_07000 [Prevotella sp.]|nr:hypothetical protein [Prevotella sp.]